VRREVVLPAAAQAALLARQAFNEVELPRGLARRADDLRLAVSEIVSNAIRHGGAREEDRIRMTIETNGSFVRVEVEQPSVAHPSVVEPRLTDPERVGGFGLRIVERLADSWGTTPGPPGVVWFEFRG
jgi:anti-sigma regulatory factor (Ser/Thr protein kinase)